MESLAELRATFFHRTAELVGKDDCRLLVLTHLLPDRPELLSAFDSISRISLVIGIPYSVDVGTYDTLQHRFPIEVPPAQALLLDTEYLIDKVRRAAGDQRLAILEIGGYFAPVLRQLYSVLGKRLIGVVEDTETGHRRYAEAMPFPCPVLSVARSPLKEGEDSLVGPSCLFSIERLLRSLGRLLDGMQTVVLGYGKVGRGLAHALKSRGCGVAVVDIDPIRQVLAISEGMSSPKRDVALRQAEVVFGCTGTQSLQHGDLSQLRDGAILASCSSKQVEFDVAGLKADYSVTKIREHFERYRRQSQTLYLVHDGKPVNFIDGAVIGPALALVQAEIMLGLRRILDAPSNCDNEILNVEDAPRRNLAHLWLDVFRDGESGRYKLSKTE